VTKSSDFDFWWKVPVVIVGIPNPEALERLWESVRNWELDEAVRKMQLAVSDQQSAFSSITSETDLAASATHVSEAADAGLMPAQQVEVPE